MMYLNTITRDVYNKKMNQQLWKYGLIKRNQPCMKQKYYQFSPNHDIFPGNPYAF